MHFKVIVEEYQPYIKVIPTNNGNITMTGPLADLFKMLAGTLNFTYSLCESVDSTWGSRHRNGTWTGMIGMLRRNEADIAIGPFSLTSDRWSAVPTSVPFSVDYAKILVKAAKWEMSLFRLYTAFTWEVWTIFFLLCIVVASTLYVNERISRRRRRNKKGFFNYLLNLLKILLTQANTCLPRDKVEYMIKFFWDFPVMILTFLLCSSFLSIMMVKKVQNIETIEQLAESDSIKPIIEKGSSMVNWFQGSTLPVIQQILDKIQLTSNESILTIKDIEEKGMNLVSSGNFAVLKDSSVIKVFLSKRYKKRRSCDYHLSNQNFRTLFKVMAFNPKFSRDVLNTINKILLRSFDMDWLERRLAQESHGYRKCLVQDSRKYRPLIFDDLKGIFLIALLGLTFSATALIWEFATFWELSCFSWLLNIRKLFPK